MESAKVKEIMVPISRYATVSENATLYEVVLAFQEARKDTDQELDKHRAVLILDGSHRVIGKIDLWDLLKGTEPKYRKFGYPREITSQECSLRYDRSMSETYGLWRDAFNDMCMNASRVSAREIMHVPGEAEHIEEDASIGEAINRMLGGELQSLLVTAGGEIRGILRLSDVVKLIAARIISCQIEREKSCQSE